MDNKMKELSDKLINGFLEDFDDRFSEEEYEEMLEDDAYYYEKVYEEPLGYEGYEEVKLKEVSKLPHEDILALFNMMYGSKITLKKLEKANSFWEIW